jgi:hypothetical protein
MAGTEFRLPIRLVPRKGLQIGLLAFFGFFFGFSIFWMAGAAGILDLNEGTLNFPRSGNLIGNLFPLFGLPFAVVGICGLTAAVLKMLPNSPYYHVEIDAEGLFVRSIFKQKRHAWRELPAFETLERRRRTKNGMRIEWYTVAMEGAPLEPGMEPGASHQREALRINAGEYGARKGQQDAADLAAWLNHLRALALEGRLAPDEAVAVPEGFRDNAVGAVASATGLPRAQRTPTVVRR